MKEIKLSAKCCVCHGNINNLSSRFSECPKCQYKVIVPQPYCSICFSPIYIHPFKNDSVDLTWQFSSCQICSNPKCQSHVIIKEDTKYIIKNKQGYEHVWIDMVHGIRVLDKKITVTDKNNLLYKLVNKILKIHENNSCLIRKYFV